MSDKISDNGYLSDKMSDKVNDNGYLSDKTSDKNPRDILLIYLKGNNELTAAEAANIINRSVQTARRILSRLVADGLVAASGANRNRKYKSIKIK